MGVSSPGDEPASIRSRLLPADPYANFPLDEWALDLQGWGSRHPLFGELIRLLKPSIIVEVGTWKGASAIQMARETKRHGSRAQIICVDTWLGSAGTVLRQDDTFRALRHRHGCAHDHASVRRDLESYFPLLHEPAALWETISCLTNSRWRRAVRLAQVRISPTARP